jgi:hypothetical protein
VKLKALFGAIALAFIAASSMPAFAQGQKQPAPPAFLPPVAAVSDAQFALGREVVQLSGIAQGFAPFVADMMRELSGNLTRTRPELAKDLGVVMKDVITPEFNARTAEMIDHSARLVAGTMSEAELKETVAFLKTPAGKKYPEMQPAVMSRLVQAVDLWNRDLSLSMMARVRAEMKKKGHDL